MSQRDQEVAAGSWATQLLAEFLAAVGAYPDERSAVAGAVEWAAEALEAEVGAFVREDTVLAAIGFPAEEVPARRLIEVAAGEQETLVIPGHGESKALVVTLEDGAGDRLP